MRSIKHPQKRVVGTIIAQRDEKNVPKAWPDQELCLPLQRNSEAKALLGH